MQNDSIDKETLNKELSGIDKMIAVDRRKLNQEEH